MKLYANARIIASGKKEFTDKEGHPVTYHENIVKDTEGSVATINSQADYSDCEGKDGIIQVQLKESGKVTLRGFSTGESFKLPEEEIV